MKTTTLSLFLVAASAVPAAADGFDEGQAKSRMEAAGYADVARIHEGNLGDWMAQATRDGRPVMVVLHPDGTVALRQQVDTPPPQPVPGAAPAKP
ncbi:hypothetical protein D3273_20445 [Lichenibacterium minor]|jgi:hypothetical protein|uniref:PepSY domain-containing protein n=1 Tax=Lichenibacterium minor TaxID=2316528 RepID=A0A4Q2U5R3_9HYPH|nr:hypothetical protein [Lichenibacterium minor]RYC30156.1 hypothetical protein D3273_20445 [Lichenibacterium minor]